MSWRPTPVVVVALTAALSNAALGGRSNDPTSSLLTGGVFQHQVGRGESLALLGSRFGVDPRELADRNHLDVRSVLQPGQILSVENFHIVPLGSADVPIVINVPQRMLFLSDAERVAGYPIAAGRRDWPTPLGEFTVVLKEEQPTWDVPASIQEEMRREGRRVVEKVPPGPENPLGDFWLGLSADSVGIHGTNAPSSIFRHTTHGCIRMHPDDIESLFARVSLGARGRIVYEPILLAQTPDGILLEAHPDVYRLEKGDPVARVRAIANAAGIAGEIDWQQVARVLKARRGNAVQVGIAVPATSSR
jgi:L,D-transpeptidase ErfK/SrfK